MGGGGALDKDRYYSFSGGGISYMNEIGPIMEVLVYFPYPISGFQNKTQQRGGVEK